MYTRADTICSERMSRNVQSNSIDALLIDPRYNGPETSGNGGWVAGSLARAMGGAGPVSVSLRAPAPLSVAMRIQRRGDGGVALETETALIAEASFAPLQMDVPEAPDADQAEAAGIAAQARNSLEPNGPYSRCFGCGIARSDGLRIAPGPIGADGMVGTTWTPPSLGGNGQLSVEATWAALDCSAGIAWIHRLGTEQPIISARIHAVIDHALQVGRRYTVVGWPIAREGRKLHAGTAIFDAAGKIQARSRQLWLIQRT